MPDKLYSILEIINRPRCPFCASSDIIKNYANFEPDKPESVYSDYHCLECDTDFDESEASRA